MFLSVNEITSPRVTEDSHTQSTTHRTPLEPEVRMGGGRGLTIDEGGRGLGMDEGGRLIVTSDIAGKCVIDLLLLSMHTHTQMSTWQ